jgi:CO dehydrogenase/acetyl-CoA synthase epsilon subunit
MTKEQELFELCKKFIEEQNIFCAETIYQSDRVIENAYEFIEDVCNIVGYVEDEDEE